MNRVLKSALLGIAVGLSLFALSGVVFDILGHGSFSLAGWQYSKMALGSVLVGLGFSLPALVYDSVRLPQWAKVLIHMGVGCTVMLAVALLVGWIPIAAGWKLCAIAVAGEIVTAFLIWLCFSLYYRRMAQRMNRRIREKNPD